MVLVVKFRRNLCLLQKKKCSIYNQKLFIPLNKWIIALTGKMEKIRCNISIPSL